MKKFLRLLVFVLALYFFVLNPIYFIYKHHISFGYKNRSFYVKNLAFKIDGKDIKINKIIFYRLGIGIKGLSYSSKPRYFYLKDGDIYIYHKHIYADANQLNIILVAQDNKPSNVPDFNLRLYERFYKILHVNVKNLYIAGADRFSNNAFALFIPRVSLKDGILNTEDYARYVYLSKSSKQELYVYVPKAYLENGYFVAKDVNAVSSLYDFNINFWWAHRIGKAIASGFVMPIKTPVFSTSTLNGVLYAFIKNKDITYNAHLNIKDIFIPKLKPVKDATFDIDGSVLDQGGVSFKGLLKSHLGILDISYKDTKDDFNINVKNIHLTDKDIDTSLKPINVLFGGSVFYSLQDKILKLDLKFSNVYAYNWFFSMGLLKGKLDFNKKHRGVLKYAFYGKQDIKGYMGFEKDRVFTNSDIKGFYIAYKKNSALVDGNIQMELYPNMLIEGYLNAYAIKLPYVNIASLPIYLSYKDKLLTLSSNSPYMDAYFVYDKHISGYIKPKHILLYKYIKDSIYTADITGGILEVSNDQINAQNLYFNASNSKNIYAVGSLNASGSFKAISGNIAIANANYRFFRSIEGDIYFTYKDNTINLKPILREKDFLLTSDITSNNNIVSFDAKLVGKNKIISTDLRLKGSIDNQENIQTNGFVVYKNIKIPVEFYIKNVNGVYAMYGKGFSINYDNVFIKLSDIRGASDSSGVVHWNTDGIGVYLYHQPILKISNIEGILHLKPFYIKSKDADVNGLINGNLSFGYDKRFYLTSEGYSDIAHTLAFIKSKLPFLLSGNINYKLAVDDKDINLHLKSPKPVLLLSKYLSLPLYSDINLDIKTDKDGYFTPVNLVFSSSDKKHFIDLTLKVSKNDFPFDFSMKSLPVYVYSKDFYYQGFVDGHLNGDYSFRPCHDCKGFNIKGDLIPTGTLYIKSFESSSSTGSKKIPKNLNMDIAIKTLNPITVMLPEGNIYAGIKGDVFAKDAKFGYNLDMKAFGGELKYSNKTFYVRKGDLKLKNDHKYINVLLMSPGTSYNTYISLMGDLSDPQFNIYSNPPMPKNQLLSSFILNESGLTALPINQMASKLSKYSPSGLASSIFGTHLDVSVYPSQSVNGNLNTNMEVQKDISKNIKLKAHISTSSNPYDTYYGASVKLTPNTSIQTKMYGNGSTEGNMSYEKRFDFGR